MRRRLVPVLALLALAGIVACGCVLWSRRPWRAVVSVNGHALSAGELALRARALADDARRVGHGVADDDGAYRRQAARLWVVKEILLAAALARAVAVSPADEQEALARMAARLRSRHLTPEQFFQEGPLPEALKRRDFQEGVLVNRFTAQEVRERIVVTPSETEAQLAALRKADPSATRRDAIDALRGTRFRAGLRALVRDLYAKTVVRSSEFPDLERIDGVVPAAAAETKETK